MSYYKKDIYKAYNDVMDSGMGDYLYQEPKRYSRDSYQKSCSCHSYKRSCDKGHYYWDSDRSRKKHSGNSRKRRSFHW